MGSCVVGVWGLEEEQLQRARALGTAKLGRAFGGFVDVVKDKQRKRAVVDAAQGIQAQTISNLYLAIENDLF